MIRVSRLALVLSAGLSLTACATSSLFKPDGGDKTVASLSAPKTPLAPRPSPNAGGAPTIDLVKPGQWPQAVSDVAPDPRVRFGVLPNGMRYAIQKNATPPGQAALRLWFDAGSLNETDDQQGLAHFLEHMAFNGSKNVPEGDMVKILERHGLSFGADTNASTGFSQTTYQLDLPKTDDDTVETGMMLLREAAGELTIAPDAVDRERGVVLSEERTRDGPGYRVFVNTFGFQLQGQRPPQRLPIGKTEILKTAPAQRIRDFYQAWYRPENAVVVAVGDFDVDAMEAKIKARFGDWKPQGQPGVRPDLGPVAKRGLTAKVLVEPGAQTSVQMAWIAPPDLELETRAKDKEELVKALGFAVLNRRLQVLTRSDDPPFIFAVAAQNDQEHAAEITTLAATVQPGHWNQALTALEQEQRRIVKYGVRQDELDREIAAMRAGFVAAAAGEATQRTTALAGGIVGTLGDREVVTSPSQNLVVFDDATKGLTADAVSALLKDQFTGSGPLIVIPTPTAIEGAEKTVTDAYMASAKIPVAAPAAPGVTTWPYATFGAKGQVVEQKDVTDLDTVFVRFANGVRLTVKPTKFRDDQILVKARIGHGMLDLPPGGQSPMWAGSAFIEGGLKQISTQDMERVLNGKVYNAGLGVEDDAFSLSGRTRPEDLDTELQVLAAYATDGGWRPEAFARIKTYYGTIHDQMESTPSGVMGRDLGGLLHGGDGRWTFPSRQQIAGASLDQLKAAVSPPLAANAIEVLIVGDTTVDKAVAAVAQTFGALPVRADVPAPAGAENAPFPAPSPTPIVRTHKGRADQGQLFMAWKTDDLFSDLQRARNTQVLAQVMQLRLTDELREKQGATYSPSASATASVAFTHWGYLAVNVETPPDKVDGVIASIRKIAADLRDKPITADELERAKKPRIDQIEKARETNEYWLGSLSGAQTDPRLLTAARSVIAGLQRVTIADVQKAAQTFLGDDKSWTMVVKPEK
ncbi:M16 family metallopeptidase [Caulobacter sp.]|uniref:M16 family metallopeptidase n=1 Tax=Caulobacter sp. TaxID=78 RepID=UPI003BAE652D